MTIAVTNCCKVLKTCLFLSTVTTAITVITVTVVTAVYKSNELNFSSITIAYMFVSLFLKGGTMAMAKLTLGLW